MPDRFLTPEATLFAFFNEVGILAQLSRAMFEARLPPGFNLPQFAVLNHLIRVKDGQTPLDLARAFQVPKTTMTHSLSVLEKHGLIRLAANPQDGRSKCVWLTDQGRAFRAKVLSDFAPDMAAILARADMAALAAALPALVGFRKLLDQMRDEP